MSTGYILDTNILSAYFKRERLVLHRISETDYYLSSIVLGELYEWTLWPAPRADRLTWLRRLVDYVPILMVDPMTSERFGGLSGALKQRGNVKGDNDLWIAAQALQHELTVVTRDKDFDGIPNLKVERW